MTGRKWHDTQEDNSDLKKIRGVFFPVVIKKAEQTATFFDTFIACGFIHLIFFCKFANLISEIANKNKK
ncbi:MAG: hypothetical protein LBH82_06675 [Bacteroidales bacterium]|jgi:hypothetical protein|nr:hypothetical protein [Bacteroidales bacterium]